MQLFGEFDFIQKLGPISKFGLRWDAALTKSFLKLPRIPFYDE